MTNDSQGNLNRDDQGAVMVIGLFLALFAIIALWSLIGIGDALIARDRSQEATDSAAFTNAVIHARGMNFIALLNIIAMAMGMLYLLVAWLELLSSLLLTVTGIWHVDYYVPTSHCTTRYLSWLADVTVNWCGIARPIQSVQMGLLRFNESYFNRVFKPVTNALYETQVWAAAVVPYLGTLAAVETSDAYERTTLSFGLSHFPGGGAPPPFSRITPFDSANLRALGGRSRSRTDQQRPGPKVAPDRRVGLPVEAEAAHALCVRSGSFALTLTRGLFDRIDIPGSRSINSWLTTEPAATIVNGFTRAGGEAQRALFCAHKPGEVPNYRGENPGNEAISNALGTFNREALRWGLYWAMIGAKNGSNSKFYLKSDAYWEQPVPRRRDHLFKGPKRITNYTYNGSDWMQIWAFTQVDPRLDRAAPIVAMPSRLFGRSSASPEGEVSTFWSQAEFYFDCNSVWHSPDCNNNQAALFRLGWRARLRRFHSVDIVGSLFELFVDNLLFGPAVERVGQRIFDRFPPPLRNGFVKAVRRDLSRVVTHRVSTGDRSHHELLH